MSKVFLVILCVTITFSLFSQENEVKKDENEIKKINIGEAYVTGKKVLLISPTDIYSSLFVSPELMSEEIVLNGAERQDSLKTTFGDDDRMYINAGEKSGVKKGDIFTIYRKGHLVKDPFEIGTVHGMMYQAVSRAKVDVVYEDRSIVMLFGTHEVVEIGNILIPYKEQKPLMGKKRSYMKAKLPADSIKGRVIHMNLSDGTYKHMAGPDDYFIASLNKDSVKRGDLIIIYKVLRADLPPLIFGKGVVLHAGETCSTIKILNCSEIVEVGHYIVPFPKNNRTGVSFKNEKIPAMSGATEKLKSEMSQSPGFEILEQQVLFDINKTGISDQYRSKLQEIKGFISKKSEYLVILRGYSCSIGNAEYNLKLSRDRVMEIKNILIKDFGFDENRIETYFYGEKGAPHDNSQEAERRKNRLVTIEVSAK